MDTWTHRSMGMDAILYSSSLDPKTSFPQLPAFQNTAHVFPQQYIHKIYRYCCAEKECVCVSEREIKHSAREKERGEREAQFNPVLSLSTASSGPVRNQQQESGIKRLCTERHSRNGPPYSPPTLVRVPHAGPRTLFLLPLAVSANLIK